MSTTTGLHPIFAECCGEHWRYDLTTPFSTGEYTYASDGRICVRAKNVGPITATYRNPPVSDLGWPTADLPVELPLPDGVTYQRVTCHVCKGDGKLRENDENYGEKGDACMECDGDGWWDDFIPFRVGTAGLATKFIAMLRSHGVTHVYQTEKRKGKERYYFKGDGFDGLVMACKLEHRT